MAALTAAGVRYRLPKQLRHTYGFIADMNADAGEKSVRALK
jgi:hypothetical protein